MPSPPNLVSLPKSMEGPSTLPQTKPVTVSVSKTSATGQGAGGAQAATNAGAGRGSTAAQLGGPGANIPSANQAKPTIAVSPRKNMNINVGIPKK